MSRLSTPLQIGHLQHAFEELNPDIDPQMIDWTMVLDEKGTMGENVEAFAAEYPQYRWEKPEEVGPGQYAAMVIEGLQDEAEPYGYDLIRARKLEGLQRTARKVDKLTVSLEECQSLKPVKKRKPRKKVTCPEASKVRVCFNRCPR